MHLMRVEGRGVGPLKEIDLDFSGISGIIALVGRCGAGKSHFSDGIGIGVWGGRLPSHRNETLVSHLVGSDAFLRPTWRIGEQDYSFEINAKNQGILRNGTGPPLAGPKVSVYRESVAGLVPPLDLLSASYFAAQKGVGGFFKLPPAERYAVFASLLNLERWEDWATAAGKQAAELNQQVGIVQAAADSAKARMDRYGTLNGEREALQLDVTAVELRLPKLEQQVTAHEAQLVALEGGNTKLQADMDAHNRDLARITKELATPICEDDPKQLVASIAETQGNLGTVESLLTTEAEALAVLLTEVGARQLALGTKEMEADKLRTERETAVADADRTKQQLQGTVDGLAQVDLTIEMCQRCPLTAEGLKASKTIEAKEAECKTVALRVLRGLSPLEADIQFSSTQMLDATKRYSEQDQKVLALKTSQTSQQQVLATLNARLAKATSAGGLPQEKRIQLEGESLELKGTITALLAQKVDATPVRTALESARTEHKAAQSSAGAMKQRLAGIEGEIRGLGDAVADLATSVAELASLERQQREWALLKDGCIAVRKAEIANVGPMVSSIATEMLASFDDGRFRIELETVLPKADGKGDRIRADFVPTVIDTFADERRSSVSGGEGEMCDEAIRGAISIWQAENSGFKMQTMCRDEVVGQLDSETAGHYIGMLRAMQERAGCKQILLITHSEAVQRQCDHRLLFENGTVGFAA